MGYSKSLKTIFIIISIILGLFGILAFFGITNYDALKNRVFPPSQNNEDPFTISVNPAFIEEGQYEGYNGITLEFTLTINPKKNITYLALKEDDLLVDRANKTSQTKTSGFHWTKTYSSSYVFFKDSYNSRYSNTFTAEGGFWGCPNCFMGEDYPYVLTFNFIYSEDNDLRKPYPLILQIPIK